MWPDVGGYFSLTDISVSEERVNCEIVSSLPRLGFLHPSSKGPDLEAGVKIELPLWLANALGGKQRNTSIVRCETPRLYRESYREIVHADACAVELAKWSGYFYELGLLLPEVADTRDLPQFLLDTFKARFRLVMDAEQRQRASLAVLEKRLLANAEQANKLLRAWLNRGVKHIDTSEVLSNIRKRKRMDV